MSTKTGGSLATVLMSVPLAAIPLMAIFGIPQFTEVAASPDDSGRDFIIDQDTDLGQPHSRASNRQRSADLLDDAPAYLPQEPFNARPLENPFDSSANTSSGVVLDPQSDQDITHNSDRGGDEFDWSQEQFEAGQGDLPPDGHAIFADGFDAESAMTTTTPQTGPAQMTWRSATRRLQELGIDNYHLERGQSFESFLFVCTFEPAGTTNVEMRFEAEADEPLAAVTDVLEQIDRWLRRTFAETRQAAILPGDTAQ